MPCPKELPPFHSILYPGPERGSEEGDLPGPPDYFADLNLDQLVATLTAGREEYQLAPTFYRSLHRVDEVRYRQEIMRDLETGPTFNHLYEFARKMRSIRAQTLQMAKLYHPYQKQAWFLDIVESYGEAVAGLRQDLAEAELHSAGLVAFLEFLAGYTESPGFRSIREEIHQVKSGLGRVKYNHHILGSSIKISRYASELDYSAEVQETFLKFQQNEAKDYRIDFPNRIQVNQLEGEVLTLVAQLFPDEFQSLAAFCRENTNYLDPTLVAFDREIQFYLAYLDYIAVLKGAGLPFCYPLFSGEAKEIESKEGFDLVLAFKFVKDKAPVICNDFSLRGRERIMVVSGPNQGGKTTFARTFGQLHHLATLGCPVPGRAARVLLFDQIHTHFEQVETIQNLRGRLHDDLVRIHRILDQVTSASIVILNELFSSTTLMDAEFLSREIMAEIVKKGPLAVWVTFIDELSSLNEQTVSMVSTVMPDNPATRTFKIIRKPADGLAYAMSIVEKHRLTRDCIRERIKP